MLLLLLLLLLLELGTHLITRANTHPNNMHSHTHTTHAHTHAQTCTNQHTRANTITHMHSLIRSLTSVCTQLITAVDKILETDLEILGPLIWGPCNAARGKENKSKNGSWKRFLGGMVNEWSKIHNVAKHRAIMRDKTRTPFPLIIKSEVEYVFWLVVLPELVAKNGTV
jgi:hypothetical protein